MAEKEKKIELLVDIDSILDSRLGKNEVEMIASWASQNENNRERLFSIAFKDDEKRASNALWCLTHLGKHCSEWLLSKQDLLVNALLAEKDTARKRMMLQLLRNQDFSKDNIRVEFLDFCLSRINAECEPYAVRCFSLYISAKLCQHFPELISELKERISMLSREPLSPGMKCAVKKVSAEIKRKEK